MGTRWGKGSERVGVGLSPRPLVATLCMRNRLQTGHCVHSFHLQRCEVFQVVKKSRLKILYVVVADVSEE